MLSNAYSLAKFRFDIAENEPSKNLQNLVRKKVRKKVGTNIGIRLDPKCFEGHLAGGIACYKRGELPQAKASFEQGLVAESGLRL